MLIFTNLSSVKWLMDILIIFYQLNWYILYLQLIKYFVSVTLHWEKPTIMITWLWHIYIHMYLSDIYNLWIIQSIGRNKIENRDIFLLHAFPLLQIQFLFITVVSWSCTVLCRFQSATPILLRKSTSLQELLYGLYSKLNTEKTTELRVGLPAAEKSAEKSL